jgi:hypothetical protein
VRTISDESIAGFFSTALKYPWLSMLENATIWRNIAPPMQLKPKPWKTTWILRLKVASGVISVLDTVGFLRLMLYESRVIISANS